MNIALGTKVKPMAHGGTSSIVSNVKYLGISDNSLFLFFYFTNDKLDAEVKRSACAQFTHLLSHTLPVVLGQTLWSLSQSTNWKVGMIAVSPTLLGMSKIKLVIRRLAFIIVSPH